MATTNFDTGTVVTKEWLNDVDAFVYEGVTPGTTSLNIDTINEKTTDAGVTVEGVLLENSQVSTDTINELSAAAGVTVDGVLLKDSQVSTNVVNELTAASGVTVDGVLLKDSQVTTDVINEKTASAGVTIDSVQLKDGTAVMSSAFSFRNKIINGNFEFWQRGYTTTFGASVYGADRWVSGSGVTSYSRGTTTPPTGSIYYAVVTRATASSGINVIAQRIEQKDTYNLKGKTVTLSFLGRQPSGTIIPIKVQIDSPTVQDNYASRTTEVAETTVITTPDTSTWTKGTFTFTVTDNMADLGMQITIGNAATTGPVTFHIAQVQLEEGSVATPFEQRPYALELSLCQRYYEKSFQLATTPAQNAGTTAAHKFVQVVGASATQYAFPIRFLTRKRTASNITLYNPSAANAQVRNITQATDCSGTSPSGASETEFNIEFITAGGSGAGLVMGIHWTADAEL